MATDRKKEKTQHVKPTGIRKGRFAKDMDQLFAKYNASISVDKRLYEEDIAGSLAHVRMLRKQEIIPARDARIIEKGLQEVKRDLEEGKIGLREDLEDVHINIEEALREKVGDVAGKLHTARSRNDQVVLDLRLYVKKKIALVRKDLLNLLYVLTDKAEDTKRIILPGYTHLQRAQPVRLGHHLMAYFLMFRRDWERLGDALKRCDEMPLGSAALAGTTFPIDREHVAKELGFSSVSSNTMDAVSDRDFAVEFIFCAGMVMMHLSRLAEELILWSSSEFGYCRLPDSFCSGSSIMPQKKNPDACELIRGKTGRVYGNLMAILTTLKALPLTYNKDLQEDKEPLFDSVDTIESSVKIMAAMLPDIEFDPERMLAAASDRSLAATDLADRLVRSGVPFRDAHSRLGAAIREGGTNGLGEGGLEMHIPSPEEMVEARRHRGGTALRSVEDQIGHARSFLKDNGFVSAATRRSKGRQSKI
ncbi:MAG: argininosuccinate lyase [Thermodesulfobacteriota bacterium]|nr:argininosuccinate lyase [Thermodesulfobacteriota bacterium]